MRWREQGVACGMGNRTVFYYNNYYYWPRGAETACLGKKLVYREHFAIVNKSILIEGNQRANIMALVFTSLSRRYKISRKTCSATHRLGFSFRSMCRRNEQSTPDVWLILFIFPMTFSSEKIHSRILLGAMTFIYLRTYYTVVKNTYCYLRPGMGIDVKNSNWPRFYETVEKTDLRHREPQELTIILQSLVADDPTQDLYVRKWDNMK